MRKETKWLYLFGLLLLFVLFPVKQVQAARIDSAIEIFQEGFPYCVDISEIKNKKIVARWRFDKPYEAYDQNGVCYLDVTGFEIELSNDAGFAEGTVTTYTCNYKEGVSDYTKKLPLTVLSKDANQIYVRVRAVATVATTEPCDEYDTDTSLAKVGDKFYSSYQQGICWNGIQLTNADREYVPMERDYFEFVKITKKTFTKMYPLIKNGYFNCDENGKKSYYDANKDGWLDPSEIEKIHLVTNYKYRKIETANYYGMDDTTGVYQCKVSGIQGLEYLPWVTSLRLRDYTASKLDLTDFPMINSVGVLEHLNKKIQIKGKWIRDLEVFSESFETWPKAKLETVDISQCPGIVTLSVGGSVKKPITVEMPKKGKKLALLTMSNTTHQTLNLNNYTGLKWVELYNIPLRSIKVTKCTKLRWVYCYHLDKLKTLDLTKAKKLDGADKYQCANLTIKAPKTAKITANKGKWWYQTKEHDKVWKEIQNW